MGVAMDREKLMQLVMDKSLEKKFKKPSENEFSATTFEYKFYYFWPLLKDWYIDEPSTMIDWMDEFYEDPQGTLEDLQKMNDQYEEDTNEMGADDKKI